MKCCLISVGLLFVTLTAFAQGDPGTITGTVTAQDVAVAAVTVQARNTASGKVFTGVTARTGSFTIAGVSVGTYEVSVPSLFGITRRYVRQNLVVGAPETVRLNIVLEGTPQSVVGDDGVILAIHNKYAELTGPAPRTPDGKPDFSGVWLANVDPNPEPAASLPWAAEAVKERRANNLRDWPWALCLPVEPFPNFPFLYRIVQSPAILVQLFIQEPHYRQVYLDGRSHPQDPDPTWMGHSIGRWDGDTLVIDSTGFNDKTWLVDLLPHTEMLHLIERYRRPDLAHLNIDVTIEDPGTLTKPLERHMTWELAPGEDLSDYICTENNKYLENTNHK
jgi:hypothetical protein